MKQLGRKRYKKSCPFFHNVVPYAMQIDCHPQQTECQIRLFDSKYMQCRWSRLTWPILCFVGIRQIRHSNLISKLCTYGDVYCALFESIWMTFSMICLWIVRLRNFCNKFFSFAYRMLFFLLHHENMDCILYGGCVCNFVTN